MTRFVGEYIADRKALHNAVRAEAGNRCIRCGHSGGDTPSVRVACDDRCTHPRDDLGSVTVFPVVPDVTLSAEAQQVAEGVCLAIVLQPKEAEWNDVRNGQLLGECVLVLPTATTGEPVAPSSAQPLRVPIRAVVINVAALPVGAVSTTEAVREPQQAARVSAESLRRVAERHFPALSATLTGVVNAPSLAGLRAMTPEGHPRGWSAEQPTALRAWLRHGHSEIYHTNVGKMRILTCHHLTGNKADNRWWNLLALCQSCHLTIQGRVIPERPWLFEHTAWFKPYVAGFYAHYYGGLTITRDEADAELDRYLAMGQPYLYAEGVR